VPEIAVPQILYGFALLVSAALLFWVQLFTAKMILPVLGGGAAVWNTCLVFFQVALLLGYLYAHATERLLHSRYKNFLHPILLLAAGIVLPVSLHGIAFPAGGANPIAWLLETLLAVVGAPFVILAGTAPLLQAWYARTGAPASRDPYFLYAASNFGSLAALASYPTIIEPNLHLTSQSHSWALGYFLLVGLIAICALADYLRANGRPDPVEIVTADDDRTIGTITRVKWVFLAFAPASLLLGVTTNLTTDVAAAPLFWVIPLFLYLLSFVLAFQRLVTIPRNLTAKLQALLLVALAFVLFSDSSENVLPLFALHLAAFFATALLCHQRLVRLRPPAKDLTEFYFLIALGGALGGIFNALIAPSLFSDIYEYPLILVLACMLRPGSWPRRRSLWPALGDFGLPAIVLFSLILIDRSTNLNFQDLSDSGSLIVLVVASLAVFGFQWRPIRFGLGIAALLAASIVSDTSDTLARARNFYGVLRVVAKNEPPLHVLYNGTTLHGSQSQDPNRRLEPLDYYHRDGPLGQLFATVGGTALTNRVGLVGLGTGAVGCYEKPGEHWTYFEINPADLAFARDPALFTFLRDCPAHPDIVLDDARLAIARQPDNSFDMIILDAFTSDAIPIHLITRDAVQLYLAKLRGGGLIVFHISNRYLDLGSVVGSVAASLDLAARRWNDRDDDEKSGKSASDWVIIARDNHDLKVIDHDPRWRSLAPSPNKGVWTDDYSNLFGALLP
jgi:hypothetical protein